MKKIKPVKIDAQKLAKIIEELEIYGYRSSVGARNLADIIITQYNKKGINDTY